MRRAYEEQIDSLVSTVARFITNRANEEMRATFQAATRPLRIWFTQNSELATLQQDIDVALLEKMDGIRYASTLRASVNRRGTWHNFDYWQASALELVERPSHGPLRRSRYSRVLRHALGDDELRRRPRLSTSLPNPNRYCRRHVPPGGSIVRRDGILRATARRSRVLGPLPEQVGWRIWL